MFTAIRVILVYVQILDLVRKSFQYQSKTEEDQKEITIRQV